MSLYDDFSYITLKYPCGEYFDKPTENNAGVYIKKYFSNRGKGDAFNTGLNVVPNKSIHTLSAFMLGYCLKNMVELILINKIRDSINDWQGDFEYSWFLTCLYHDTVSSYERIEEHGMLNAIINLPKLKHTIYGNTLQEYYNLPNLWHSFYEEDIQNYFEYRLKEMKSLDHGILGGYILFDKLVKNFERNFKKTHKNDPTITRDFFVTVKNGTTLIWKKEHLWHFGYVANAIIAHNIWFEQENTDKAKIYTEYGLDRLITSGDEDKRIKLDEDPLLFFLAIIDTIEPVKYFKTLDPLLIWKNIDIKYEINTSQIVIIADNRMFDIQKWYNDKIKELSNWLCIDEIKPPKKGEIIIKLPRRESVCLNLI